MKPETAYAVAVAAVEWQDARATRIAAKKARNQAIHDFAQGESISDEDRESEEFEEATGELHRAYRAAAVTDNNARARMRAAVARAKKEMNA